MGRACSTNWYNNILLPHLFICKTEIWSDILALPEVMFNMVLPWL
jgi:hypothetical protein